MTNNQSTLRWRRALLATTAVLSLGQNAWAVCSDGNPLPADGYVVGRDAEVQNAANFSPNIFTAAAGSLFIPDNSKNEHNNPAEPLTGGGHNWVFDQGSTLCKVTDTGDGGASATGWNIPPNTPTDCVVLPIIKGGRVTNLGDIPFQGQAITPVCDTSKLGYTSNGSGTPTPNGPPSQTNTAPAGTYVPNPSNSYFNQLGCTITASTNIVKGVPTPISNTPATATSWLFVAGIQGGLFSVRLDNVANPVKGGDAGKTVGPQGYYSDIPEGLKLTSAAVSPDGRFAMATSIRRAQFVYACLNPLGDPGDPTKPITTKTVTNWANTALASQVKCMQVGTNNLQTDLTTAFGPDLQPYFGGQRVVNSFNSQPGGTNPAAWPQCVFNGVGGLTGTLMQKMQTVFNNHNANHCGNAQANFGFTSALITQPSALIWHTALNGDKYMYTGPVGGTVVQFKLTTNPVSGMTSYKFRTLLTGVSLTTGLGVANDLTYPNAKGGKGGSLIVMTDPSSVGLAAQGVMTRLPLCEDME